MDDFVYKPYRFDEIYDCLGRQLGLKFVHRQETADLTPVAVTPDAVAALPEDLRRQLRIALERLDAETITTLIGQIGNLDAGLAAAFSASAKRFDYEGLQRLLDTAATAAPPGPG
jgi:hypothetical protein